MFISVLILALSCQKQQSPEIAQDTVKGAKEIERMDACSNVNFNKGVLLYQNVQSLFVCTKWDEQFPQMFESIKKVKAADWDHAMAPIDKAFIENQVRRDRVFKNIRDLDSKGGLDGLSYVIVALNETNFFDSTKALFTCVENPTDPICASRLGRIPEKKSLKKIINLIDVSPEAIDNFSTFLKMFVKSLNGHQEDLRNEINKFRSSPLYIPLRLKVVDSLADKVRSGISNEDRDFFSKILLTGVQNGDTPWIYNWIQDVKMSREKFRDLVEYPILTNPEFIGEIKGLELAYDSGLSCSIRSTRNPNELIEFDFKKHMSNYVSVIQYKDHKSFYDFSSEDLVGLKMSTEVCQELENNRYNVNFIKLITHFSEFLSEKKYYDLVRFLVSQTTAKGDIDKTFAENLYLFDLMTGNIFSSTNALNKNIVSSTREFYPLAFDIVKSLPAESYINLGEFVQAVSRSEFDERYKGLANVWTFFTAEEKNFLFNFLDRHFDKGVDYYLLFDFYTKFLDDFRDVQPELKDSWMGTAEKEEMSYLALQGMFSNFSGKETLLDFKKFFSRDQILKVLEVISNGQTINKLAKEELEYIKSDNYVIRSRSEKYKFKISYDPGSDIGYDSRAVLECMQKFSDVQNGYYELIHHMPQACSKVKNENIAFRFYGWMNSIEETFSKFNKPTNNQDSFFDERGIMGPYMMNTSIGLAKIMDNLLGSLGSSIPTNNGINYLLTSTSYYLNQREGASLAENNLKWLNSLLSVSPQVNTVHRNTLVKSFAEKNNFSYSKTFFENISELVNQYGQWVKSGQLKKTQERSFEKEDPTQRCENVINQIVSPGACPNLETVKIAGNDLLFSLQKIQVDQPHSPVALLMKAAKVNEGLQLPKRADKFRLTLRDTFRYFYDGSDKSFNINNQKIKYISKSGKTSVETLTTLERIESVIREVRFERNYLGASFLNAVVHGDDYNKDVAARKKLLQKCSKIPYIRCGRKMSDDDLRMTINSLEVYDGLSDINNGRGLSPEFKFGDYLKTFETSLVLSSSPPAQKAQLLPLKDEILQKHNGEILSKMTMVSAWSNAARVIRDRVGRTRQEFEKFIESEDFKRVDRSLLYGFEFPETSSAAERILNQLRPYSSGNETGRGIFNNTADWIATLDYQQTRLVEDTVARLMVVGSFLGPPEIVFNQALYPELSKRYARNNLSQIFLAVEKIIDYWPTIKNNFPTNANLIDVVKPINTGLYFLTEKLNTNKPPNENTAYLVLNDLFLILQKSVFDNLSTVIGGVAITENKTKGMDILLEMLKDPVLVSSTYNIIKNDYKYLDVLHEKNGQFFLVTAQNMKRLTSSKQIDLDPLRLYLEFTSKPTVCLNGEMANCPQGYHYDEPAKIINYLNQKSESGRTYFMVMNDTVFKENIDQISQMINDLLPCLKIKEIKVPLILN